MQDILKQILKASEREVSLAGQTTVVNFYSFINSDDIG